MKRQLPVIAALIMLNALPSRANESAALLDQAPPIALDTAVLPLAAPIEVATVGWGPFRRLCVTSTIIVREGETPRGAPSCLLLTDAREDSGVWSLTVHEVRYGRQVDPGHTTTRDATGRFGPVTISTAPSQRLTPRQLEAVGEVYRAYLQSHSMTRTVVAPGSVLAVPAPRDAMNPGERIDDRGFVCRAEGEGVLGGRRVLIANCAGRAVQVDPARPGPQREIAGRFAVDVATGLVLRHSVALRGTAAPGSGDISPVVILRQSLE